MQSNNLIWSATEHNYVRGCMSDKTFISRGTRWKIFVESDHGIDITYIIITIWNWIFTLFHLQFMSLWFCMIPMRSIIWLTRMHGMHVRDSWVTHKFRYRLSSLLWYEIHVVVMLMHVNLYLYNKRGRSNRRWGVAGEGSLYFGHAHWVSLIYAQEHILSISHPPDQSKIWPAIHASFNLGLIE